MSRAKPLPALTDLAQSDPAQPNPAQTDPTDPPAIAPALVAWQRQHGRHSLPWQRSRDPYRVWLSEIMLQQTQVATVLGYYDRFLQRFPGVAELAAASLDEVLALWSGLGYYSRARNLHRCAQAVMQVHGGQFPNTAAVLASLPGIGRSTAAAIAAFCFSERVAILDGNVKRVLTRVLAFEHDLAEARHERALWAQAEALLPASGSDMTAYTQGLMDLGATLCQVREPQCLVCPLAALCRSRAAGNAAELPRKTRKLKRSQREHWWLWLDRGQGADREVWLEQRPPQGVWAGLWTLPLLDDEASLQSRALAVAGAQALARIELQPTVRHALTHLDWTLHPRRVSVGVEQASVAEALPEQGLGAGRWVRLSELDNIALPAPLRKLLLG